MSTQMETTVNERSYKPRMTAPVKKIPNVHSDGNVQSGGGVAADPELVRKQLVQEKQKNKILQLEIERLRKSLEVCKNSVKDKSIELETKNKLINKLMENKTQTESSSDNMENDIDIDNLLSANLGEVDFSDILNLNDSNFTEDLDKLDIINLEAEQATLPLSPSSMAMAVNTNYVVEDCCKEDEVVQVPNREGSDNKVMEDHEVKNLVERMVDQKQVVSPIRIIKGKNKYLVANKKQEKVVDSQSSPPAGIANSLVCPHCGKSFPLGGQWKLTRHMNSVHGSSTQYICQYCDKHFPCKSVFTAHKTWHHQTNPWQCEVCEARLGDLTEFISHVRSLHQVSTWKQTRQVLIPVKK